MPLTSVVFVSDSATIDGGAAKVAIDAARAMSRDGLDVRLFAGGEEVLDGLQSELRVELSGGDALRAGPRTLGRAIRGIWNAEAGRRFDALLSECDPRNTVVHVHSWGSRLSPSVFAVARARGFATVISAHDYLLGCPNSCRFVFPRQEICQRRPASLSCLGCDCDRSGKTVKLFRLVRYAAQVRALRSLRPAVSYVSTFQRDRVEEYLAFPHTSYVVDNPVGTPDRSAEYTGQRGPFLYAGRLEKEKGVDVFCRAVELAGVPGLVVGDGAERESLAERYPMITFRGWASVEELSDLMVSSRALVFPSRWYEAAPLTPLEAQLVAGLPCIISDACAASEYVEHGVTGYVFESGDAASLARWMRELSDPDNHAGMRATLTADRARLRLRYSVAAYTRSMRRVYAEVLASGTGGSVAA